jgi:hypothetical protein
MTWLPHALYGVALLIITSAFWLVSRIMRTTYRDTIAAYQRLLDQRDAEYTALADRSFAMKNVPPSGVDMTAVYEERREEQREKKAIERQNGGPVRGPQPRGPVDRAQLEMEASRRRELQQNTPAT